MNSSDRKNHLSIFLKRFRPLEFRCKSMQSNPLGKFNTTFWYEVQNKKYEWQKD